MPPKKQDFEADYLAPTIVQHGKDINGLDSRITELEGKLSKPEQFAISLEAASADSKRLDKLFSQIFCQMMERDEDVKKILTKKIDENNNNRIKTVFGRFGAMIYSGIIFVLGAIAYALISKFIK